MHTAGESQQSGSTRRLARCLLCVLAAASLAYVAVTPAATAAEREPAEPSWFDVGYWLDYPWIPVDSLPYGTAASTDSEAEVAVMARGIFDKREASCRRPDFFFRSAVGTAVKKIVRSVPETPHLAALPLELHLEVTVSRFLPVVTTDVTDIVLLELAVRDVDLEECRSPLSVLDFVPRVLPDSGTIMLKGMNVTAELQVVESGMFGIAGHSGRAIAKANGDLNLTISMDGFNDTTVTACGGAFETVCAESMAL